MTDMTFVTCLPEKIKMPGGTWTIAEAKARFSELLQRAGSQGPQTVTRRGRTAAIVVSPEEWERKTKRTGNLADFLAASPLRESGIETERRDDLPRPIDL